MLRAVIAAVVLAAGVAPAEAGGERCDAELAGNPSPEVLYNAGVCFEQSRTIGHALRAYETLMQRYPKNTLAQKAMARAAVLYEAIAYFDKAARLYLDYSRRYAGDRDAPNALRQAIVLLDAIGDRRGALRAVEQFVKSYGRKRAGDAAEVYFAAASLHQRAGDDEALAAHLERYLAQFGSRGGRDRAAIAHAVIGEILWKRSCPLGDGAGGTCRAVARSRRARPPRCDPSVIPTRRARRDPRLVKKARDHLTRAVAVYRPPPRPASQREQAALHWRTLAELLLLEKDFEELIDDGLPRGLDFDPKKRELSRRSIERFREWLEGQKKQAAELRERYRAIIKGGTSHGGAAAFRYAQIAMHLRDQLAAAPIPRVARRGPYAGDLTKAYCEQMRAVTRPLVTEAVGALERCLAAPGPSAWSQRCARELTRLAPAEHPEARERHGAAVHLGPVLDTAGAVQ